MPRPKKGTKGDAKATERWRNTMAEKYGDISAFMAEAGRKGGKATGMKGFALNPEFAKEAGRKGGTKKAENARLTKQNGNAIYRYRNNIRRQNENNARTLRRNQTKSGGVDD